MCLVERFSFFISCFLVLNEACLKVQIKAVGNIFSLPTLKIIFGKPFQNDHSG